MNGFNPLNNEMMLHFYNFYENHAIMYTVEYVILAFNSLEKNHWWCYFGTFSDGLYDVLLHDVYVINKCMLIKWWFVCL